MTIIDLEKIPGDLHDGIIEAIHKGRSMYNLDNYRPLNYSIQMERTDERQYIYSTRDMCTCAVERNINVLRQ